MAVKSVGERNGEESAAEMAALLASPSGPRHLCAGGTAADDKVKAILRAG